MSLFTLSEQKALTLHYAVLGLLVTHPNLVTRAQAELAKMRSSNPALTAQWDRWAELLVLPLAAMAEILLSDTAEGGLLRANSPFTEALSAPERKAIWQRIGLMQFMKVFFDAATDLALDLSDQAAITGIEIEELTNWQSQPPQEINKAVLQHLKQVVALDKALIQLAPEQDMRRHWLRQESATFSATPLSLLRGGKAAFVLEHLTSTVQLTLGPDDLPRIGNF